jgi:hypothetical protein
VTGNIVTAVKTDVRADRHVTCMNLATTHVVLYSTKYNILHDELSLVKVSEMARTRRRRE